MPGQDQKKQGQELAPTRQSREAFDWLASYGNVEVEQSIVRTGHQVREIVPECVGLSLTVAEGELTFTLMVDRPEALTGVASTLSLPVMHGEQVTPAA